MKPSSRISRILKRLVFRAIHTHRAIHPVTARCCGLQFQVSSNCRIVEDLYTNGFERLQRGILEQIILPGSTVLDVGANLGFYTCLFASKVGPTGKVIAVEPTPSVFQTLQNNIALNGLNDRVAPLQIALSDTEGTASMHVFSEGNEVYNSLGAEKSWLDEPPESSIDVSTKTMDLLLAEIPNDEPCFIKIDVEGFQHQVLQGGINRLNQMQHVALMVELNDNTSQQCGSTAGDSLELMSSCGFQPYATTDGKHLEPLSSCPAMPEGFNRDIFFFKELPPAMRAA